VIDPHTPESASSPAGSTSKFDSMLYNLATELMRDAAEQNAAASAWTDDFVVLSEFSEHEGPIAVQLIPESAAQRVDVSDFVVRIMAVDVNRGSDSELGKFNKDSQVLCDVVLPRRTVASAQPVVVLERWSAYVHHLTLLDVYARGYVRPICVSYLSREPRKLADLFIDLSREFTLVADTLKRGNYDLFRHDVERRIADLEFTRSQNRAAVAGSPASPSPSPNGPALDEHLEELRVVLTRLRRTLSSFSTHATGGSCASFDDIVEAHDNAAAATAAAAAAVAVAAASSPPGAKAIVGAKYRPDVSAEAIVEAARSFGEDVTDVDLYGHVIDDDVTRLADASLNKRTTPRSRELRGSVDFQQTSTNPGGSDSSSLPALSLPQVASSLGAAVHTPMLALAEATRAPLPPLVSTIGFVESEPSAAAADPTYRPQVIKSLQRAERFDERLRDISTICTTWHAPALEHLRRTRRHFARPSIALALERADERLMCLAPTLLSFGGAMAVNFDLANSASAQPEFSVLLARRLDPSSASVRVPTPASPVLSSSRQPSVENLRELQQGVLPNLPQLASPNSIECYGDVLWSSSIGSGAGHGLLHIVRRCSFARHLVASLMRSRPVVIRGSARIVDLVRAVVRAFAVFVPRAGVFDSSADAPPAVVLWRGASTPPLRLSDLATLRLVGLASEQALSSTVESHVSIYDVDEQTLVAPPYEGSVLAPHTSGGGGGSGGGSGGSGGGGGGSGSGGNDGGSASSGSSRSAARRGATSLSDRMGGAGTSAVGVVDDMLSMHRKWTDESTFLAFVHQSLFELAAKAALYYHMCCVEAPPITRSASYGSTLAADDVDDGSEPDSETHSTASSTTTTPVHGRSQRRFTMNLLSGATALSNQYYSTSLANSNGSVIEEVTASLASLGTPFTRKDARSTFFRRMGVPECDIDIVVNLAELIKLQQDAERRPANAAPTVRLDYRARATFRNTVSVADVVNAKRSPHSSMSRF
jgi:hypothetical protein